MCKVNVADLSWSVSGDLSSASELSDNDSDDSDSRELSGYSCRHCYTTSECLLYASCMAAVPVVL